MVGCATVPAVRLDQGPVQEQLKPLEEHVLADSQQLKKHLEESGALYEEDALQAYLDELARPIFTKLESAGSHQLNLRVVRDPTLNAFTLGDGSIYINTGLIARLTSAQQLAFIVGHETSHVLNRDLLYFTDAAQRKTVAAKLTELVVTPALSVVGLGGVADAGVNMTYAASIMGYGREREARADEDSVRLMQQLGYDPREALRIFDAFLSEDTQYQQGLELAFLSSHPSNEARRSALQQQLGRDVSAPNSPIPDKAFLTATEGVRLENASLDTQLGRYHHAINTLEAIIRRAPEQAMAHALLADAYRLIAEHPERLKEEVSKNTWKELCDAAGDTPESYWRSKARESYERASSLDPALPEPYRGLGLLAEAEGRPDEARQYLQRYLTMSPDAKDRRFVMSKIVHLQPSAASQP